MKLAPFDRPGRFFKGNLHTHSMISDGHLPPEQVVTIYRDAGYDFLALTDHFLPRYNFPITDTRLWRDDHFTTILGAELHVPGTENGDPWHILAVGLPPDFAPPAEGETGPEIAARAAAAGAFVGIAHPAWYTLTLNDALSLKAAHAVEVFNTVCDAESNKGESWHFTDLLLCQGRRLLAYAADDAHFAGRPDHFCSWVQVRAERLDPDLLLAALLAGDFYSSEGPELWDIALDETELQIRSSPVVAINVTGRASRRRSLYGDALTGGSVPIDRFRGDYCRITVIDRFGRRAWSNPIWID